MTAALRFVIGLAIAASVIALAAPWLDDALYIARLMTDERPATLPLPVQGATPARVRDTWGADRPGGRRHEGIDIFAPRGTPVLSATRGLVWRTGDNALGGRVVWVLGPGGDMHYYAHLDRIAGIRPRQRVDAGTVLGYVGTSGNAERTPPHLHYGIYRAGGGAINPYPLLAAPTAHAVRPASGPREPGA
jgi:murein DD-endopeptidase MepM/ murein hydrolase activator NlpD